MTIRKQLMSTRMSIASNSLRLMSISQATSYGHRYQVLCNSCDYRKQLFVTLFNITSNLCEYRKQLFTTNYLT